MRMTAGGLLLFAALVTGCGKSSDPLVFGHLDPKSDDDAEYRALALAVDATNADPSKQPFERRVNILHAVAGKTADEALAQAVRLAAVDKVFALLGGYRASIAERISQAAQENAVLAFTLSGWAGPTANPYVFPIGISPADEGKWLAQHARDQLKVTKVVVLVNEESPLHKAIADAFTQELGKERFVRISIPPRPQPQGKDANAQTEIDRAVRRVAEAKASALYLGTDATDGLEWIARLQAAKEPAPVVLFGGEEADLPALREDGRAVGWYAATAFFAGDESPRLKEFAEAYRKKYSANPPAAAALAHDAYQVLLQACRRAGEPSGTKVRDELRKKDASFEVLTGALSYTTDQSARRPGYVVRLQKDGAELVKRLEPATSETPAPAP
jgi:branched-chain amino acid transport system substrate-binding protein